MKKTSSFLITIPTALIPFLILLFSFLSNPMAWGQFAEGDLGSQNPAALVIPLLGPGVSASNVTYQGIGSSAATFTGGAPVVGFNQGIILSTGQAAGVLGAAPVTSSTCNNIAGDADLAALAGTPVTNTYDATVLEFDFIPTFNNVTFNYVFASEEYNKYVGSTYNDVFGFFVNGVNVALIPATATNVSINNVNDCANPTFFIDNFGNPQGGGCTVVRPPAGLATAMNGLTTVLTATSLVNPGVINHIKLAIADVGDCRNDSNVFIEANSFSSAFTSTFTPQYTPTPCICTDTPTFTPTPTNSPVYTDTPCGFPGNTCTFTGTPTFTPTWTSTDTPTFTTTVNVRPTNSFTATFTPTITPTPTRTPTPSPSLTATNSPTPTITDTPCGYPGNTCTFTPVPVPVDIFYVDKNLFNPAVDKTVLIRVGYSEFPGEYSLRIYNTAGEHIQTLDTRRLTGPLNRAYTWNGTNKNGDPCASGVYILQLVEPYSRKIKRVLLVR